MHPDGSPLPVELPVEVLEYLLSFFDSQTVSGMLQTDESFARSPQRRPDPELEAIAHGNLKVALTAMKSASEGSGLTFFTSFVSLPTQSIPDSQLARFSRCSTSAYKLVHAHGWPAYARQHLYISSTTHPARLGRPSLTWADKVRIATSIDSSWSRMSEIHSETFHLFSGRTLPVLALQEDSARLWIAGGSTLSTFRFSGHGGQPVEESFLRPSHYRNDRSSSQYTYWIGRSPTDDVTAIAPCEGTGEVFVSHVSGLLQKCKIDYGATSRVNQRPTIKSIGRYSHPRRPIQALSASPSGLLACATSFQGGAISLYKSASPWLEPRAWKLKTKPWSLMLEPHTDRPRWLAVGHSGSQPLSLYNLREDGLPTAADTDSPMQLGGNESSTAVYAFSGLSSASPIGRPSDVLISGWYDGTVRLHDLRCKSTQPILTFVDPFANDPVYSVANGGGGGYTIAAGIARYGLVRLWDVRNARSAAAAAAAGVAQKGGPEEDGLDRSGHSLYGPGKDNSPVYGLQMEHDRLFGITDRRGWMLEFAVKGQGVDAASTARSTSGGLHSSKGLHRDYGHNARHRRERDTFRSDDRANRHYYDREGGVYYYSHAEMKLKHSDG